MTDRKWNRPRIPMTMDLDPFTMSSPIGTVPLRLRERKCTWNDLTRIAITQASTATPHDPAHLRRANRTVLKIKKPALAWGIRVVRAISAKTIRKYSQLCVASSKHSEISDQTRDGHRGVTQPVTPRHTRRSLLSLSTTRHTFHPFRHG